MHTNKKLFDLATKNAQRNAAGELLSSLPVSIKPIFEKAEVVFHPEVSQIFSPILHRAIELHKLNDLPKVGARTLMTSSREKALMTFFQWVSELPCDKCVFVLGEGNGVSFNGASSWVSSLPGYLVTTSEAVTAFRAMSALGIEQIAIAAQSTSHAVVLEVSSGILPDEPSASEVVYELASW